MHCRDRAGVLNEYQFVSKLISLCTPRNAIKLSFATKYTRPVSESLLTLFFYLFLLFSHILALSMFLFPPPPPISFLDVTRNCCWSSYRWGEYRCKADWYAEAVRRSGCHWVTKCWVAVWGRDWWSDWLLTGWLGDWTVSWFSHQCLTVRVHIWLLMDWLIGLVTTACRGDRYLGEGWLRLRVKGGKIK
jgi:hypothetical protein